jgi:hypothetical protein
MADSMTADTMTAGTRLIPLAALRDMLAAVMRGREYLSREPYMRRDETGWLPLAELPADEGLRLSDFLDVIRDLPDPCPELQAAEAIVQVIRDRGHAALLRSELEAEWERRWPDPVEAVPAAIPDFALLCQWCGNAIPAERGPKAKFCRASHRVSSHRAKKRAAGRANPGASPVR